MSLEKNVLIDEFLFGFTYNSEGEKSLFIKNKKLKNP